VQFWQSVPDVTIATFTHPQAHAQLRPDAAKNYDAIVLYDLWQNITDEAKTDFVNFLKAGKGLLVLHHAIANYQNWPEYWKMAGGRYYLNKTKVDGVEKPRSTWKHDVQVALHVADPAHPVTRGLKDFTIHDETYGLFDMNPDSHALLTSDTAGSGKNLGWCQTYEAARVVYLQLGHDHLAWDNPNFKQLVSQALGWVAKKD
jgi:type 1 glutamine amidotransferase